MAVLLAPCSATDDTLTLGAVEDLPEGPQYHVDVGAETMRVLEVSGAAYRVLREGVPVAHATGTSVTYVPADGPAAGAVVRARLTAYLESDSPTAASTVTAVKDLIRAVRYLERP